MTLVSVGTLSAAEAKRHAPRTLKHAIARNIAIFIVTDSLARRSVKFAFRLNVRSPPQQTWGRFEGSPDNLFRSDNSILLKPDTMSAVCQGICCLQSPYSSMRKHTGSNH